MLTPTLELAAGTPPKTPSFKLGNYDAQAGDVITFMSSQDQGFANAAVRRRTLTQSDIEVEGWGMGYAYPLPVGRNYIKATVARGTETVHTAAVISDVPQSTPTPTPEPTGNRLLVMSVKLTGTPKPAPVPPTERFTVTKVGTTWQVFDKGVAALKGFTTLTLANATAAKLATTAAEPQHSGTTRFSAVKQGSSWVVLDKGVVVLSKFPSATLASATANKLDAVSREP